MLRDGGLLQKLDVPWSATKCCLVLGLVLAAVSAVLFYVLFKHVKGKVRRLDPHEAGRVAFYGRSTATEGVDEVIQADGVGVGAEIKFGIDDLRQAARRGDWMTFWLSPLLMTSGIFAFFFIFTAGLLFADAPGLIWGVAYTPLFLMLAMFWFMPWAALYTNIDAGTARTPRTSAPGAPGRAAGGTEGRR